MTDDSFERLIARLEHHAADHPRDYQFRVTALAGLGLLILFGIFGGSALVLAGLAVGAVAAAVAGGGKVLLLLKLGLKPLLLIVIPLWILVRSSFQAMFSRFPAPEGVEVVRASAPVLFERLDGMRAQMKGPRFHHVLLTNEMNAAVVQRPLFGLFGFPRNYLVLGLPLLEATTENEALAVLAHEYGHLAGAHSRFGGFIYRLRRTWATIDGIAQQWDGVGGRLLGRLVRWYAPYFNAYTFVLARTHEYLADAASAELVGPGDAASALRRVSVVGREFDSYVGTMVERVRTDPEPPTSIARQWAALVAEPMPDDRMRQYLHDSLSRKTDHLDTHPALADRIAALAVASADAPLVPVPSRHSAARRWFGDALETQRSAVGAAWAANIRSAWSARFAETTRARTRLDELAARSDLTRDEQYERFSLARTVDPKADILAGIEALCAAGPDEPRGHFILGHLRLEAHDDSGLEDLETAMRLDPECTLSVCQTAAAYLHTRDPERSRAYLERARQREALQQQRLTEFRTPGSKQALHPHGLPPATVTAIEAAIRNAGIRHIGSAHLVRRVLPVDPAFVTYLLAVRPSWWGRFRRKHDALLDKLVQLDLPLPYLLTCVAAGHLAHLLPAVRAIEGSRLDIS